MNHDAQFAAALMNAPSLAGIPIRPDVANPDELAPYIVYLEVAIQEGTYTLTGESSLVPVRYQVDVYAATRLQANAISSAVIEALLDAFGAVLLNRQSLYESDTRLRHTMLDMSVWFENG